MNNLEIKNLIENFLTQMGVSFDSVEVKEESEYTNKKIFIIKTKESGLLIGEDGETFKALSHIIKRMVEKNKAEENTFSIDVNDYRASMIEKLKMKAGFLANRARDMKSNVEMEPMTSYERLIIHGYLTDQPNIKTESVGEGRERRVVIKYVE